jgi:hypothetical protein
MEYVRNTDKNLVESPKGRDRLEDQGEDGRIILDWISREMSWKVWIGFYWLRRRTCGGFL